MTPVYKSSKVLDSAGGGEGRSVNDDARSGRSRRVEGRDGIFRSKIGRIGQSHENAENMSSAPASASAMVGPSLGLLRLRAPKEQSRFGIEIGASSHTRQKPLPATGLTGEDGARRGVNVSLRNWAWQNGERCYARREGRTRGSGRAGTLAGRRAGRPAAPVLPSSSDHRGRKEGRSGDERCRFHLPLTFRSSGKAKPGDATVSFFIHLRCEEERNIW